jgi:hypothetical protein
MLIYEWRSNGPNSIPGMISTQKLDKTMHREVRASLTSVSELSLRVRRRKT